MEENLVAVARRLAESVGKVNPHMRENKHGDKECVFCGAEEYWVDPVTEKDDDGFDEIIEEGYYDLDHESWCPMIVAVVLRDALWRAENYVTQPSILVSLEACLE